MLGGGACPRLEELSLPACTVDDYGTRNLPALSRALLQRMDAGLPPLNKVQTRTGGGEKEGVDV